MKRFNNEDEDFGYFEEAEGEEMAYISEEDYQALVSRASAAQEAQLELAQQELNQRLLAEAIDTLKRSFWWRFRSYKTRLKMIAITYRFFHRLTDAKGDKPQL